MMVPVLAPVPALRVYDSILSEIEGISIKDNKIFTANAGRIITTFGKAFGKHLIESQILLLCGGLDLLCLNQLSVGLIPNLLFFFVCFSSSTLIFCN